LVGTWQLDTERTTITVRTRMFGIPFARSTLRATGGHAAIGTEGLISGHFDLDPASISSRIAKRDQHLREPDFLDVENHPAIRATIADSVLIGQNRAELTGLVEVRGKTSPLTMVAAIDAGPRSVILTTSMLIDDSHLHIQNLRTTKNKVTVEAHFSRG